jgi:integrase
MNIHNRPGISATLQDVLTGLDANPALSETRRRDLRSAVNCFAALTDSRPSLIPLDLPAIRSILDLTVPIQAKVSRKRWANLRSDLAAAIAASGLLPMVNTASVELSDSWVSLFERAGVPYLRYGLSRFARWASERQIAPAAVNKALVNQFIAELLERSLVRNIIQLRQNVVRSWNALICRLPNEGLQPIAVTKIQHGQPRVPWNELPQAFRDDVDHYMKWASVPDPLDDNARRKPLARKTLHLRRDQIHSAVTSAVAAGVRSGDLVNLGCLVEIDTFKKIFRHRFEAEGRKLTAYTHGVAGTLVAVAAEWVKVPSDHLSMLKAVRRKLGQIKFGLTDKNKNFLRKFDDRRVLARLLNLPDKLWRQRTSELKTSRFGFVELQSGLAIEISLVAPLRMGNLSALAFDKHICWPHGYEGPAWIIIGEDETKNKIALEFELPQQLSDRLTTYRNEIVPNITGVRATHLFVTWTGKRRSQAAVTLAIEKTVLKYVGVRLTPHQFRHLAAKLLLDQNPDAYPLVQQLMGHRNLQTTINFYAGINTRRAGRAHSELISRLKKEL